ncbi:ATP-binding protein [Flavisolibacter nicotianae]|uniref:ATP-binding protein n=1 Tax=Flavisolibacter nicotianae TaxID=2364882 RepID=UPI000EB067EF|nr:sensor histidine kinase [Flavisolibacter nicotianae]
MCKAANCAVFLLLLLAVSCRQTKTTEMAEATFWRQSLLDSTYRILFREKDTVKAFSFFDSALQRSPRVSVYPRAARFDLKANYYYFFTSDNEATARSIDSALAFYNTAELQNRYPRTYVGLLLFGGQIAYRLTQYSKANEYYFRAKKLAEAHLSPCEQTAFNYNIAMVLFRQENYRASLRHFREAYAQQESCAPQTFGVVLQQQEIQSNIGECFVELKAYDSALVHFDKALAIAARYKDTLGPVFLDRIHGVVAGNKAKVRLAQNRLEEAEQLCLKAIALNDREGYEVDNAREVKLQLAEIYRRQTDFSAMFRVLGGIMTNGQPAGAGQRLEWQRLMAAYYEQTALPELAIPYLKAYSSLNDSIQTAQKQLTEADVARQLRDREQQLQIAVLKEDKEQALLSLGFTIVFSGMTVALIYLVYQHYRRSKKTVAVLQALNKEISAQKAAREEEARQRHQLITEAVIRAQEAERSLIGLELHDNINQVLTTVKLHNEMVLEGLGEPRQVLPRTVKYLQDCINEIRSLSRRLSAPTLGRISLEESIKDLIDSINATSKVTITHQIAGLENQVLKQELHLGVYRILQEQLNNILKHAEASEVFVLIEQKADRLELSVTDNGKGFAVQGRKAGIGLLNMQTRAESLNGTFQLESQPGRGCKVAVVLPCQPSLS